MGRRKKQPVEADVLFDPARLAEEAIRANLDPACFDQIDESEIRWPANWFEWARDPGFLNLTPFAKQVETCTNLYGQFCPACTDPALQAQDENWGNWLLQLDTHMDVGAMQDRIGFLEHGQCPQCGVTRPELLEQGALNHYQNLAGLAGMRSSKSTMVGGMIGTYQLIRFLRLPSPSKYFGLLANQTLHGTFTAVTATQCYDTLWQAFKDRVDSSPWFAQYHNFLTSEAERLGKEKLYDYKDTFIWYGHKQLSFSYCGPDIRTIRGRTRYMSSIDELGWMDVQAEGASGNARIRMNAKETHEALIRSLQTIRSVSMKTRESQISLDPPDAFNADVSSPSGINDAIMQAVRLASRDRTVYAFHYATWEMNPNIPLGSLTHEMGDPATFERDYQATPPLGANQFIDSIPAVEKAQSDEYQTRYATWDTQYQVDDFGQQTQWVRVAPRIRDKVRPRCITVDTGLTNNSFAVTMWSYDKDRRYPVCDLAIECQPGKVGGKHASVNFPKMYQECIEPLLKSFWVCLVVYDRWNSIDRVQQIRMDHRVEALQYSLKWNDFTQIRSRVLDSGLVLPRAEQSIEQVRKDDRPFEEIVKNNPATHLALQILTVRAAGRKVIKPFNGTDDLFRCLCLAITFILDPRYTARFERYGSGHAFGMGSKSSGVVMTRTGMQPGVRHNSQVAVRKPFGTGRLT